MKLWAIPYNHRDGTHHTLEVYAHDADDARHRIREAFYQAHDPQEIVFQATAPAWGSTISLGKLIGGK